MNKGKDPVALIEHFLESIKNSSEFEIEKKEKVMKIKHNYHEMEYSIVVRKFTTGWMVTSVRHLNYNQCTLCGNSGKSSCVRFLIPERLYLRANRDKVFHVLENHKQTRLLLLF